MKLPFTLQISAAMISFAILLAACAPSTPESNTATSAQEATTASAQVKRVGMVIRLKEDMIDEYKRLHADDQPGVRDLLSKYNMRNFSIFLHKLDDGNYYEFGYYEYVGSDFEEDMRKLAAEPRNQAWLEVCDPMQVPLEGYTGWAEMEQVYFNE